MSISCKVFTFFFLLIVSIPAVLEAHQPHDPLLLIAASPNFAADHTLIAATDYLTVSIGVYLPIKSTDGGVSWIPVRGLPNLAITAIRFSPTFSTDSTVFIGGGGGLFRSSDAGSTWTQVSVNSGVAIEDLVVSPNFASDGTLFAVSTAAVYESTDRGNTFQTLTAPSTSATFSVCAISPNFSSDHTFVIGDSAGDVFKTTSAGSTWTNVTAGLGLSGISAIVFTPAYAASPVILLGTLGSGVYGTQDGGTTWAAANSGITDLNVTALSLYPNYTHAGTALVTTKGAGVFLTTNRARTWTATSAPNRHLSPQTKSHFRTLATPVTSSGTGIVFMGMFEGMWSSTNLGATWTYVDILPTWLVRHLQISATYPTDHALFATNYGGGNLFSSDGANSWSFLDTGFTNSYPDPGAFSPNFDSDHILFSGIVTGLERTTNTGAAWTTVPALGATNYPRSLAVSPNFAQDQTVMIGLSTGESGNPITVVYKGNTYYNAGMFLSTDGGLNWIPTSLNGPAVYSIAISPAFSSDRTAFAGTTGKGLYKSTDGGLTWNSIFRLPSDPQVLAVLVSPSYASDQTAFVATSHSGIYKTTNGGDQWTPLAASVSLTAISLAISPNFAADQTLFVGTFEASLLKSTDGGSSFQDSHLTGNFVTGLAISPGFASDGTIYAADYTGIFKSTDGGNTWAFAKEPNRMEDSRIETVLLAGTWQKTADKSASGGSYSGTNTAGSTATIRFYGSGLRWISPVGPNGNFSTISIDGGAPATVSLSSPQLIEQQAVYQTDGLACTAHTAVIAPSATAEPLFTYLDAVDILRDGCSY